MDGYYHNRNPRAIHLRLSTSNGKVVIILFSWSPFGPRALPNPYYLLPTLNPRYPLPSTSLTKQSSNMWTGVNLRRYFQI